MCLWHHPPVLNADDAPTIHAPPPAPSSAPEADIEFLQLESAPSDLIDVACPVEPAPVPGSDSLLHYLDDFGGSGPSDTPECAHLLSTFQYCMLPLGAPIAGEKTEGPTSVLSFLGLQIDAIAMVVHMPLPKVCELVSLIRSMLARSRVIPC